MALRVGVLGMLSGNEDSIKIYKGSLNKKIKTVTLNDALVFKFEDGSSLHITDEGRFCCESRYMSTDDELTHFFGAILTEIELVEGPDEEASYGVHDTAFMKVKTSEGMFTVVTHNKHNGYYGGFLIRCTGGEA